MGIAAALDVPDRPDIVVVLTDGLTPWPEGALPCRVIAALIGPDAPQPPDGVETVRVTPLD